MSKDQIKNTELTVETVENLIHLLSYISSTLTFWNMDTIFPCNLIKKACDDHYEILKKKLRNDLADFLPEDF